MSRTNALRKLEELKAELPAVKCAPYDHPDVERWRLSVESLLISHLGETHSITIRFRGLAFRVNPLIEMNRGRDASQAEHQAEYLQDLEQAEAILSAAVSVWFETPRINRTTRPQPSTRSGSPVRIHLTNNNNPSNINTNTSTAQSTAVAYSSAVVEFPLDELLGMVDASTDIPEEEKPQAKDMLESLDGELRKKSPRWDKVSGFLKGALDLGKEVAIKTIAAVVAEYTKNHLGT